MDQLIDILTYIFLGLVQGIAEILPISSSGHLILLREVLHLETSNLAFEVLLHIASLLALLIFFRKEVWKLIRGCCLYIFKQDKEEKGSFEWTLKIVIATIPAAILGFLFEDYITDTFSSLLSVGISLLITAIVIFYLTKKTGTKKVSEISYLSSFIIGLFQGVALVPGISRSGTTMAGGATQDLKKEESSLFAFMLFIPVSLGAFILKLDDLSLLLSTDSKMMILLLIGFITSFAATLFALKFIFNIIRRGKTKYFSYYCIVVGVFAIIYSFF